MNNILDKNKLFMFYENFKISKTDQVWIHHPITEDLIIVNVKSVGKTFITVEIPIDSPYYGQPDFLVKKTNVIGLK